MSLIGTQSQMCYLNLNSFLQTATVHFNRVKNKANCLFRVFGDFFSPNCKSTASKPRIGNKSK